MTGATDGPATLIDRLYTVPDSGGGVVGEEEEEEEGEAHRRYKRELMKYRRTAKVVKSYPIIVVLCASLLVNWPRLCILCTRNTVERLLVTSRHSIGCVVYVGCAMYVVCM